MLTSKTVFVVALFCLAACSTATEPVGYVLPDPDLSLNPAALVVPTVLYACNAWAGGPPAEEELFVDIAFNRAEKDPADRPLSAEVAGVQKHGGQIVHRFNFPAVRAWMKSSEIPSLYQEGRVNGVYRVTNPRRYDWSIFVGYKQPYLYTDGEPQFAQLGGRVVSRYNSINAFSGVIPDASVSTLRGQTGVDFVEASGLGCLD